LYRLGSNRKTIQNLAINQKLLKTHYSMYRHWETTHCASTYLQFVTNTESSNIDFTREALVLMNCNWTYLKVYVSILLSGRRTRQTDWSPHDTQLQLHSHTRGCDRPINSTNKCL